MEGAGNTLVKNGAATLTVAGTNFMPAVQINAGEYLVSGTSSLFFSDVTLADAAGVVLTLGQNSTSASIGSLSGGGTTGGILQPNNQARTVTATLFGAGTFGGVAQDNGSGKLALTINATTTLTGTNTYSGATSISGTLALSGNGSALNSAVTVNNGGTLRLDNSTAVLANRVSDAADVTVEQDRRLHRQCFHGHRGAIGCAEIFRSRDGQRHPTRQRRVAHLRRRDSAESSHH